MSNKTSQRVSVPLDCLVRLVRDSHRFFVKESPAFVGRVEDGRWAMPWQARLFWPMAWMRFMRLMMREGMHKPNTVLRRSEPVPGGNDGDEANG